MGMFRTVLHPSDGRELQFKTGEDYLQVYRVGDTVEWTPHPAYPGAGIDDVYETYGANGQDDWVVIKDGVIVAVEPLTGSTDYADDDRAEQYEYLYRKYAIKSPDPKLWTDEQWAAKRTREEESAARYALWQKEQGNGDSSDAVLYARHCALNSPSYRDAILPTTEVTDERRP